MSELEIIITTLRKMGVEPSFELVRNIELTYHSCALSGSDLTLEETTKLLAQEFKS